MDETNSEKNNHMCVFCGKEVNNEMLFMEGYKGYICEDCIQLLIKTYNELPEHNSEISQDDVIESLKRLPKPKEIKSYLDKYIVGQDKAKQIISTAIYNHYKRIIHKNIDDDVELLKSNILLVGKSGCGKTEIARTVAKMLEVPFTIVDATCFTESGYVGEDVESILSRLYQEADYNKDTTEIGIVFIDEIDKIAKRTANNSITKEVRGEGVQQALLKLLEDSIVNIPPKGGRKHPDQDFIKIDTKNILFICSGAFVGMEEIIGGRINKKSIGFNIEDNTQTKNDNEQIIKNITQEDIKKFGFIPELIGRLPVIAYVEELNEEQLVKILTEPKNSIIKQYRKLLKLDDIKLLFENGVYELIAKEAIKRKIGARALKSIVEEIMQDIMFEAPSSNKKQITITKKMVNSKFNNNGNT